MPEVNTQAEDHAPIANGSDFGVDPSVYDMGTDSDSATKTDDGDDTKAPEANAPEGQAVDGVQKDLNAGQVPDQESVFELTKGMSLKVGDKVTPEHIKEFQRAALRESDYTRKTQELAQVRGQAQEVLQVRDAVLNDPRALRQHLEDDHILQAFHPNELLVAGLQASKIPPQVWNQFLEDYQQTNGKQPGASEWQANPMARELHQTKAELARVNSRLQNWEQTNQRSAEDRANHEARTQLKSEVEAAAKKFQDVTEEEILEAIAAGRQGNAEQIAKRISDRYSERISKRDQTLLEQKKRQKNAAPKGTSVPVLPNRPKTWEDAGSAAAAYLNGAQE